MKLMVSDLSPVEVLMAVSAVETMVCEGFEHSLSTDLFRGTPLEPFIGRLQVVCMSLEESAKLAKGLAEEMLADAMRGYNITLEEKNKDGGSPLNSR